MEDSAQVNLCAMETKFEQPKQHMFGKNHFGSFDWLVWFKLDLVWFGMVRFSLVQFSSVWFSIVKCDGFVLNLGYASKYPA